MSLKIYTFYSDSHEVLLEKYFLPSFEKTNKDIELKIKKINQKCKSGDYMSSGWYEAMINKVDYILESIEETWGGLFVHSDCDVQFFKPIKDDLVSQLGDKDFAAQDDGGEMCCGFFICKSNDRTKKLFENVKKEMNEKFNDQQATNKIINKYASHKFLDYKYYSIYRKTNKKQWNKEMNINYSEIPKEIIAYHANWTVGLKNKIELMNILKKEIGYNI